MIRPTSSLAVAAHYRWQMLRIGGHLLQTGGLPAFWAWLQLWYWAEFRATTRELITVAAYAQGRIGGRS